MIQYLLKTNIFTNLDLLFVFALHLLNNVFYKLTDLVLVFAFSYYIIYSNELTRMDPVTMAEKWV